MNMILEYQYVYEYIYTYMMSNEISLFFGVYSIREVFVPFHILIAHRREEPRNFFSSDFHTYDKQ